MEVTGKKQELRRLLKARELAEGKGSRTRIVNELAAHCGVQDSNVYWWMKDDKGWTSTSREARLWAFFGLELTPEGLRAVQTVVEKTGEATARLHASGTAVVEGATRLASAQERRARAQQHMHAAIRELLLLDEEEAAERREREGRTSKKGTK